MVLANVMKDSSHLLAWREKCTDDDHEDGELFLISGDLGNCDARHCQSRTLAYQKIFGNSSYDCNEGYQQNADGSGIGHDFGNCGKDPNDENIFLPCPHEDRFCGQLKCRINSNSADDIAQANTNLNKIVRFLFTHQMCSLLIATFFIHASGTVILVPSTTNCISSIWWPSMNSSVSFSQALVAISTTRNFVTKRDVYYKVQVQLPQSRTANVSTASVVVMPTQLAHIAAYRVQTTVTAMEDVIWRPEHTDAFLVSKP